MTGDKRSTSAFALLALTLIAGCATDPAPSTGPAPAATPTPVVRHTLVAGALGPHVLNCIRTSGHHVYATTMTCPLDGEEFETLMLGTHSTYGVSLDWESMSYMRFPTPLPVCPTSGFIVTGEDLSDEDLDRISDAVQSDEYQTLYAERHATYYLYAKLTEILGQESDDTWWFYRQATSEADVCNAPERYRQYALATIEAGEERLEQLTSAENEFWTLSIVIPNMYRRIGEFDAAIDWLTDFGQTPTGTDDTSEAYALGHQLLRQAIAEGRTERIPLEAPE